MFFTSGKESNCSQLRFNNDALYEFSLLINQSNGKIFQSLNIISKYVYYLRAQVVIFQKYCRSELDSGGEITFYN